MDAEVELVLDAQAALGEGAIWHAPSQQLYWVDIEQGRVHSFSPADGCDRAYDIGQMVGAVVPRTRGGVMLALHHGLAAFDPCTGQLQRWCDPESPRPRNRFNDGKCDPAGRFWAGTINLDREPRVASLYCLEPDGCLHTRLTGVTNSNGLAWSLDQRTFYYIDTPTRQVTAFDYDVTTGHIDNPRSVITMPADSGKPDGMTIDAQGMLWIAHFGGGCVGRWDPHSGTLLSSIAVPARKVTSCAFGGQDLNELYITTARTGLSAAELAFQPHAGGLFRVRSAVHGVPAFEFIG